MSVETFVSEAPEDAGCVALLLISAEGLIVRASALAAEIFGIPRDQMVGREVFEFVRPADRQRVLQAFTDVQSASDQGVTFSFRSMHRDGSSSRVNALASNSHDEPAASAIALHVWTSGDSRPTRSFHLSDDRVRLLLENAVHITAVLDADGSIRYISPAADRMLGYPAGSLLGQHVCSLVHPDDRTSVSGLLEHPSQLPGRGAIVEFRIQHRDGSWRVMEAIATNRLDDPDIAGLVIDARDVTERKWSADRLQRSLDALLAIHDVGRLLGSSIEKQAIATALLEGAQRLAQFDAGVLRLQVGQGHLRFVRALGPRELWEPASNRRATRSLRVTALASGIAKSVRLLHTAPASAAGSICVLPLRVQERVIGVLELYRYTAADNWPLDQLGILADQAAGALERGRLYQALAERERRLERVIRRLLLTQEEERRRVAYEVHDGLAQLAAATQQHLDAFATRYRSRNSARTAEVRQALDLAGRTVREARRVISGLRPTMLDDFGLAPAISFELQSLRAEGWSLEFVDKFGPTRLDPIVETALFRVLQEALANVHKHAKTKRAVVTLERHNRSVRLEVRDWGCGFRPSAARSRSGPSERVGLAGMQERVALLHGRFTIRSRPGAGARVNVEVPFREVRTKSTLDGSAAS